MFIVSAETLKSARKHGMGRAYMARLVPGLRGSIDRQFVKAVKINKNRQLFSSTAHPGDVFEIRRWRWDMMRQQYYGGTVWIGVQRDGRLTKLTRDEAFHAVHALGVSDDSKYDGSPANVYPERIVPDDIRSHEKTVEKISCQS